MAKIEIAYRTQNFRSGTVKNHRKFCDSPKVGEVCAKLEERGAFDIYVSSDLLISANEVAS